MTGTDVARFTHKSVPVIFEPPCISNHTCKRFRDLYFVRSLCFFCVTHKILVFLTSLLSRHTSFFSVNFICIIFVLLYGALLHSVAERLCNDLVAPEELKLS